jgi:diguanylate cyclase (GGDEF)-like protein
MSELATAPAAAVPSLDHRAILASIGEAVYDWDLTTDRLLWGDNAASLMQIADPAALSTGAGFGDFVDPASPCTRSEAIAIAASLDDGQGVPFKARYAIAPRRGALLWFEDTGRWFAGVDGRPVRAHGTLRLIEAPSEQEWADASGGRIDYLTGALTRAAFARLLETELKRLVATGKQALFLFVSIENLAQTNRDFGFDTGDQVIAGIAARLRGMIRGRDRLVRYAGNKLGILLCPYSGDDHREAAERLLAAVRQTPIETVNGPIAVSLKIGLIALPSRAPRAIDVFHGAEEALAEAKGLIGRHIVVFAPDADRIAAQRRNLTSAEGVLAALNEGRILLAFEPVISAETRQDAFAEALLRVQTVDGRVLGASAIVPAAERLGLIRFVDQRVVELATDALLADPGRRLSMNVSMASAMDPEWLSALSARLAMDSGIAERLIIEITETAAIHDLDLTARFVRTIKGLGLKVAIDDFGSGHTSLRAMRALNVDYLKIDGTFIHDLARSTDDRFFVRTLIDLARHLGVATIAEWVQDAETASLLAAWGVDYLQGEFCGAAVIPARPAAAASATPLLQSA